MPLKGLPAVSLTLKDTFVCPPDGNRDSSTVNALNVTSVACTEKVKLLTAVLLSFVAVAVIV